jgi:hypothetical protein
LEAEAVGNFRSEVAHLDSEIGYAHAPMTALGEAFGTKRRSRNQAGVEPLSPFSD